MVKDIIKHNEKEYQLSTVAIENVAIFGTIFETMIFPIKNGIVSGNEVYCYRTRNAGESKYKHQDIYDNPEKYLSEKAIEGYFACKNCHEWCCTLCQYSRQ